MSADPLMDQDDLDALRTWCRFCSSWWVVVGENNIFVHLAYDHPDTSLGLRVKAYLEDNDERP
jgi:hypothetical protein